MYEVLKLTAMVGICALIESLILVPVVKPMIVELFELVLSLHEVLRIFGEFRSTLPVLVEELAQVLVVVEVPLIVGARRVLVEVFGDVLVLVEELVEVR
jgi:hypothetical protein